MQFHICVCVCVCVTPIHFIQSNSIRYDTCVCVQGVASDPGIVNCSRVARSLTSSPASSVYSRVAHSLTPSPMPSVYFSVARSLTPSSHLLPVYLPVALSLSPEYSQVTPASQHGVKWKAAGVKRQKTARQLFSWPCIVGWLRRFRC